MPIVAGLSPFLTESDLYLQKTQRLIDKPPSKAAELGNLIEGPLVESLARRLDYELVPGSHQSEFRHDRFVCHPDGLIRPKGGSDVETVLVEAKFSHRYYDWGPSDSDEIPSYVMVQVQSALQTLRRTVYPDMAQAIVTALIVFPTHAEVRDYTIDYHPDLAEKVERMGLDWWERHVERGVEPEGAPPKLDLLGLVIRREDDSLADVPQHVVDEYLAMKEELSQAKKRANEAKASLLKSLGDHVYGVTEAGYDISFKEQTRREHVVRASTYRVLRVKAPK